MRLSPLVPTLALAVATLAIAPAAEAVGPGGWDRLGTGPGGATSALNGDVLAMTTDYPGVLIAGGKFTNAGGIAGADRVAFWDGAAWHALGPTSSFNGDVMAVATANSKIYAGGTFTNAGGDADADHLSVYDGTQWKPFCTGGFPLNGNVTSLRVVGNDLYVGGEFQDAGNIATADYLVRCDLTTGTPSSTVVNAFTGPVYALTSDSSGNLYAGGGFIDLEANPASDRVAMLSGGGWSNLGTGAGACGCAVTDFVRSLASDGTNVYVGADSTNIAGIPQADHVARWDGAWHAVGANAAGTDGYLPAVTSIDALLTSGTHVYATGNWFDLGGDPKADYVADFDGTSWKPIGSNGAGNGPLNAKGESMAVFGGVLHLGGNFTSAGGDPLARFIARFAGVPVPVPVPSNAISLGKLKTDKAHGTAKLSVAVPGAGTLTLTGKSIKGMEQAAAGAGAVVLKIKPKGKLLNKLRAHGEAKVKVTVTYTPTGGTARSETKKVKLVLRRS